MCLQEKLEAVTKHSGGDTDIANIFSDAEMSKLWNRLRRQREHHPEMAQSWEAAQKLPRGQVRVAKRELLWLWVGEGMKITKRLVTVLCPGQEGGGRREAEVAHARTLEGARWR